MDKSIAFIMCVNDENKYEECVRYINSLYIPDGFKKEIIAVRNSRSMASGYNYAMNKSKAKYKVYLHQDTMIINKNFIYDILEVFKDNKVGMIGAIGCEKLPADAVLRNARRQFGKVYESSTGYMRLVEKTSVTGDIAKEVQAVDGFVMITQYDIPWREDIFDGYDFYDISQCMEFQKQQLKVVVPFQEQPWFLHDCKTSDFERYSMDKERFLNEYSTQIYPLVSVLIPTYNRPYLFELALKSVLDQTYRNIEIIICDDSTNNETENVIKKYTDKFTNIQYYKNEKRLGQFENDLKLMSLANGRYINFLMDDDLFKKDKIEKMMNYFIEDFNNEISLVTSNREVIDDEGVFLGNFVNDKLIEAIGDKIVDGKELCGFVISNNNNIIGEPTTVLFDKTKLSEEFGIYNGRRYICNVDQATWYNLLDNGKAAIIKESLSSFRVSENQQSANEKMIIGGMDDYVFTIQNAMENGHIEDINEYYMSVIRCIKYLLYVEKKIGKKDCIDTELEKLKDVLKSIRKSAAEKDPLVSILVPTYNQTKFLEYALDSAVSQDYPNIEIIIGDDSTNDDVEKLVKRYISVYDNITYYKNVKHEMDYGISNVVGLLKRSNGEYVNFLFHDDVFMDNKIGRMMDAFENNPNLVLVTSPRQLIDENNNVISSYGAFRKLFNKDTVINGNEFSNLCVKDIANYIGEPTTVLFKKRYITEERYGYLNGKAIKSMSDLSNWINILQYGDAMYLAETLSCFRHSGNNNSSNTYIKMQCILEWFDIIEESHNMGIIDFKEYRATLNKYVNAFASIVLNDEMKALDEEKLRLKNECIDKFNLVSKIVLNSKNDKELYCPICNEKIERFRPYQYKTHSSDYIYKYEIIGSDEDNFLCPNCSSFDRERHLKRWLDKLDLINNKIKNKRVLHIAPEANIRKIIKSSEPVEYVCADLFPKDDEMTKVDITKIQFEDEHFDFIICNHVLEHIPEDYKAINELYRVLKTGGCAILQTPYSKKIDKSFEDSSINTDELRKEYYGQEDHIRIYGKDLFDRIKKAGFKLNIIKNSDLFEDNEYKKYGFNNKEDLILVEKINNKNVKL